MTMGTAAKHTALVNFYWTQNETDWKTLWACVYGAKISIKKTSDKLANFSTFSVNPGYDNNFFSPLAL